MAWRMRWLVLVSLLLGGVGGLRDARAGATVDLLFVAKNGAPIAATNTVDAVPGDVLTLAVMMRNDQPLTAAVFSLNYDTDADDELDVVSAIAWRGVRINSTLPADFFQPLAPLSPITPTFVGSFQGITTNFSLPRTLPVAGGAYAGGYQMGTVTWKVNAGVNSDGADILSGLFEANIDGFGDAGFNDIGNQVLFRGATVNSVPEPGTAALLAAGLLALRVAARRRGRP